MLMAAFYVDVTNIFSNAEIKSKIRTINSLNIKLRFFTPALPHNPCNMHYDE